MVSTNKDQIDEQIKKAEEHIDQFEYESALQFCQTALDIEPNNVKVLELSAGILLELGEIVEAKKRLERTIECSADAGHMVYFSLAQLLEGTDCLKYYQQGIQLLQKEAQSCTGDDVKSGILRRELSSAYCSLSELFMTDLCDEDDAETQCVDYIEKAISTDAKNPEAYQCKASYLIVKGEINEAKAEMNKSLSLWLPQMNTALEEQSAEICSYSYDSRISAAKLLIELEEYQTAVEVFDSLITEDDEVVEVWYLLGFTNFLRGEGFETNSRYYLKKAQKVAAKTNCEEAEMLDHIQEMLEKLGPGDDDNDSDDDKENCDDDDDDDYSTISNSSDENDMEM